MAIIYLFFLLFMIIFSLIDIKFREIPSVLLTGALFVFAVVNFNNIQFGILAFIFAYLLYEINFIGGVADIKLITAIGFMMNSWILFIALVFLIPLIGSVYKVILKKYLKEKECPFIPCLTIVYFVLLLLI